MDDGDGSLTAVRRVAWWIADTAVLISISFSLVAHFCLRFADHHKVTRTEDGWLNMPAVKYGFAVQVGQCFGYVAIGWIVVSGILAITCRARYGIARETTVYLVLLLLAIITCGALPAS